MSKLVLPNGFGFQPQYPAPIDYTGLGKGAAILLNPGAGLRDQSASRDWSLFGNAALRAGQLGKNLYFDGGSSTYAGLTSPDISSAAGTFAVFASRIGVSSTYGHVWLSTSTGNNKYYHIYNSEDRIDWGVGGGSTTISLVGKVFNTVNTSLIFSTNGSGGSGKVFYFNGVATGTPDATAPAVFSAGANSLVFGKYWGGDSWNANADVLVMAYLPGVFWGATEAKAFHDSRGLALFKAPARRLWVATTSSGINLIGANSSQANTSSTGAISQNHILTGANSTQADSSSTGAVTQTHVLAGSNSSQANAGSTGVVSQTHRLTGANASQANAASTGSINKGSLVAANCVQANLSGTGAVVVIDVYLPAANSDFVWLGTASGEC